MSDMAHFYYIHFAFPTYFKNIFDGHVATQYMDSRGRPDIGAGSASTPARTTLLKSEASYFGPSYMINWLWNDFKGTDDRVGPDQLPLPDRPRTPSCCSTA